MNLKRKSTTPIHIILGIFVGILYHWYPGLSALLMFGFLAFERWQDKKINDSGEHDFWEGLLGCFIGAALLLILRLTGVI